MRQFLFTFLLLGVVAFLAPNHLAAQSTFDPDDVEVEIISPTSATQVTAGTAIALDFQIVGDRPCPSTLVVSVDCDGHSLTTQTFSLPAGSTLPYNFTGNITCPNAGANEEELEIKAVLLDNGTELSESDVDVEIN